MGTEEFKPKRVVEKRASDGMLTHLIVALQSQPIGPMLVCKTTIIAETQIQLLKQQFGVTQQIQLQDLNYVTQLTTFTRVE